MRPGGTLRGVWLTGHNGCHSPIATHIFHHDTLQAKRLSFHKQNVFPVVWYFSGFFRAPFQNYTNSKGTTKHHETCKCLALKISGLTNPLLTKVVGGSHATSSLTEITYAEFQGQKVL